jgi:hypothetical protein
MDEIDIDDERHRREEAERRARRHRTREEREQRGEGGKRGGSRGGVGDDQAPPSSRHLLSTGDCSFFDVCCMYG